jgi:hypothetical protein
VETVWYGRHQRFCVVHLTLPHAFRFAALMPLHCVQPHLQSSACSAPGGVMRATYSARLCETTSSSAMKWRSRTCATWSPTGTRARSALLQASTRM